jgi:hypothetical protein
MTEKRALLRHTLATVAYRGGKALRGAPPSFADYRCVPSARTPAQILAHVGDLFDWARTIAEGKQEWHESAPLSWDAGVARFFDALQRFDEVLASEAPLHETPEKLFQGPIADALTHVGQLAMLRRLADAPIKAENYHKADIVAGRVGSEQSAPKREF